MTIKHPFYKSQFISDYYIDSSGRKWTWITQYNRHPDHPPSLPFGHPNVYLICPDCRYHCVEGCSESIQPNDHICQNPTGCSRNPMIGHLGYSTQQVAYDEGYKAGRLDTLAELEGQLSATRSSFTMIEAFLQIIAAEVRIRKDQGMYFVSCYVDKNMIVVAANLDYKTAVQEALFKLIDLQGISQEEAESYKKIMLENE